MCSTFASLAILIPAYQAEASIGTIVGKAKKFTNKVLVGDDGSTDRTAIVAKRAGATVIRGAHNRGKGATLRKLFAEARKKGISTVITLDADGQHDPLWIPLFLEAHVQYPRALILGNRMKEKAQIPPSRYIANRLASLMVSSFAGYPVTDSQCGFRLIPSPIWQEIQTNGLRFEMEMEFLLKTLRAGFPIHEIDIPAHYPNTFSSHFCKIKDTLIITRYLLKFLLKNRTEAHR